MTTTRFTSLAMAGISLTALAACNNSGAKVLEAQAITREVKTPHEECSNQVVTRQKEVKDDHRVIGTLAGAVVGAVVGNKVGGKGTSQDIATVGGAAAGGYAGNRVQKNIQDKATEQTTERVCQTRYDSHTEETGSYRVRYVLNGQEGSVTMDHNPGGSIPVQDGKLVL